MTTEEIKKRIFSKFMAWLDSKGIGDHFSTDVWMQNCFVMLYQQFAEEEKQLRTINQSKNQVVQNLSIKDLEDMVKFKKSMEDMAKKRKEEADKKAVDNDQTKEVPTSEVKAPEVKENNDSPEVKKDIKMVEPVAETEETKSQPEPTPETVAVESTPTEPTPN